MALTYAVDFGNTRVFFSKPSEVESLIERAEKVVAVDLENGMKESVLYTKDDGWLVIRPSDEVLCGVGTVTVDLGSVAAVKAAIDVANALVSSGVSSSVKRNLLSNLSVVKEKGLGNGIE